MDEIFVEGIPVKVTKKKMRNLRLTVKAPRGEVFLSAPLRATRQEMEAFIRDHLDWLNRVRAPYLAQASRPLHQYQAGERLYLFDTPLTLEVRFAGRARVQREGARLILFVPAGSTPELRKAALGRWYREELRQAAAQLAAHWEPFLGVHASQWEIREMTTRWGSCNPRSAAITLNLRLASKPRKYLEYVVVHELCHLLEPGHTSAFWAQVERCLPDWKIRRRELNRFTEDAFAY